MTENQKLINRLSLKYGLPYYVIEDMVNSQFEFTRKNIKEIDYNDIQKEEDLEEMKTTFRFPNIGSLAINFNVIKKIRNLNKKKNED